MPKKTSQSIPTDTQVAPPSNHWKFILAGIVIAILGGIALVNQTAPEMLHLTSEKPSVSGEMWDFSESDDKVPYDTKVLSLILPTSVDSGAITVSGSVTLTPHVDGVASLSSDQKTLTYTLSKTLSIGETYELRIAGSVQGKDGKKLGKDQVRTFTALPSALVQGIFPKGNLDTLSQNITVVFNMPMVRMTNLTERDKLACPLTITPKVEGKCAWTNTSILEFTPSTFLQGATHYHLEVTGTSGLLHTLSGSFTSDIMTTPLHVTVSGEFSPLSGIPLTTNVPVNLDTLLASTELFLLNGTGTEGQGTKIESIITPDKNESGALSETSFTITPKSQSYTYNTNYSVTVHTTLKPKYGTEPLGKEVSGSLHTNDFVWVSAYQNILSASGIAHDTRMYGDVPRDGTGIILPSAGLYFLASFDQEIPLDTSFFLLRSRDDHAPVEFDIVYSKKELYDTSGNVTAVVDDKLVLRITPKAILKNNTDYEFVVQKKANRALTSDTLRRFHTAPELLLSGFQLISNTVGCVYSNSDLGDTEASGSIVTNPLSRKPTITQDYGQNIWNSNGSSYTVEYTCPQVSGKIAYIVDLRLDPERPYSITFGTPITDTYNQHLAKPTAFTTKTGPISPKDQYLYSSLNGNQTQVIPSTLPVILGLLSINIDTANIDVCEMDQQEYLKYLDWERNTSSVEYDCKNKVTKKIPLKNHFWTQTPTKIDIEKDVLGHALITPFIYIHGYISDSSSIDSQKQFTHVFLRSNLSLAFEDGKNSRILFASSYDAKTLPPDLTFEAYNWTSAGTWMDGSVTKSEYTRLEKFPIVYDAKKQIYTIADPDIHFDLLIAKNKDFYGILDMNSDQTSNYDFKYISGMDASNRDYLYIYPERPLYKRGDTVSFKGILRSYAFDGYHLSAVKKGKLKILSPQGESLTDMDITLDEHSNFHGSFLLPETAPFGRYSFEFVAMDEKGDMITPYTNGEFFLDAYKKPVFKVVTDPLTPDVMVGATTDVHGHAEYYFGGMLGSAEYQYSILSQKYYFNPRDYSEYSFSRDTAYRDCLYWSVCEYSDSLDDSGTGKLDAAGNGTIHHTYTLSGSLGEKISTYSLEVTDPDTGKTVNHTTSQIVHATDGYVGVKAPYWNSGKSGVKLDGVVLDYTAKGVASKDVGLELVKREWKNVKKQGVDGVFYNEGFLDESIIATAKVRSDQIGGFQYTFLSATGGEYELRATYTGSNGIPFTSSTYAYVSGGNEDSYWLEGNNAIADLTPDKSILSVGERAGFTLKTPIQSGKMLISIEKDDGILDSYVQDITSTTTRIEFGVLDSYIPNVYVKVFALGQNPGEKLPTYKRALSVIKVLPDPKKLSVTISADKKQYLPGEKVKITVSVKDVNGKGVAGANGSLSVVDESLLALAGNPEKNPFAFFYDMKRYLGVVTYTSLQNLIQKLEVKDVSQGEKGGAGDGQKGGLSKKKRGEFKDTAFWQADFTTDQNGNFTLTTPVLPDNLTTWVIESVVNTAKTQVGAGQTHIQTTKTVVINDNLPRFLGTADTVEIAPVIFNKTEKDGTFDVSIEADHVTLEKSKQSVDIKAGDQLAVPFRMVIDGIEKLRTVSPRASKITIKAVARSTGDMDLMEVTLPIIETTTTEQVATSGRADPTSDEEIVLQSDIRANGGALTLHYAATLLPGLLSGIDFLAAYPYGCIEQKLAAIMPQVYMKELYESLGKPYDLSTIFVKKYIGRGDGYIMVSMKDAIDEMMTGLKNYQHPDGGFGYWTALESDWSQWEHSNLSLTLEVVDRLQDLAKVGFSTPPDILSEAAKYIKQTFYTNKVPFCIETCGYALTDRLHMIAGVLDATPDDYEAYKMYQVLVQDAKNRNPSIDLRSEEVISIQGVDFSLAHADLLIRLAALTRISGQEKSTLLIQAKSIIKRIVDENVVVNPRGAFIGRSESSSRLSNTLAFIDVIIRIGGPDALQYQTILDQMTRWVMSEKKLDGSWGSTADTTAVVRSITGRERMTREVAGTHLQATVSLDSTVLDRENIGKENALAVFSTGLSLDRLQDDSVLHFEKVGTGRIYYDIALQYALKASSIKPRDEGFFIESAYYDYAEYRKIEKAKEEEWHRYLDNKILYTDLQYPRDVVTYLKPLSTLKIGELIIISNRMITPEPRDQVAFEGFIPSGTELVNPNLKTESADITQSAPPRNSIFDHEEWQDDRYFGTTSRLDAGVYTFSYIVRPTHVGTYELRPTRVSEFYHPEVFGRTAGKNVVIEK